MPRLYTKSFLLLCASYFFFFASFNLLIPELPNWLGHLGGESYKGLIIGVFTISAGLSRPFSGRLADTLGRKTVIFIGVAICILTGFLYPLAQGLLLFFGVRLLHGFSTGFTPTGTSAYIADIVPGQRRGEAMGIVGLCGSLGMAVGPYAGATLAAWVPMVYIFWLSSLFALVAGIILLTMPETLVHRKAFSLQLLKIRWEDVYEARVKSPAIVTMLTVFSFGVMLTLVPDLSDWLGINRGLFFLYFTLASVSVRFFAGKLSDRLGRARVLKFGCTLLAISMSVIGFAQGKVQFLAGAILFGIATGINSPTTMAWTIDLGLAEKRGRALATMFMALELGIGLGAVISGWLYNNQPGRFGYIFAVGSILAALAMVYLTYLQRSHTVQGVA